MYYSVRQLQTEIKYMYLQCETEIKYMYLQTEKACTTMWDTATDRYGMY